MFSNVKAALERKKQNTGSILTAKMSTHTCLSSGTDGSTLSPRRGGVSPTRRRVVDSTVVDVVPVLVSLVCSV